MAISLQAALDAIEDARDEIATIRLNFRLLWGAVILLAFLHFRRR